MLLFASYGVYSLLNTSAYVPKLTLNEGEFTALSPARIHDGKITENETIQVQVTGKGGVPTANVSAVVANITVASPTKAGYMTVFPTGTSLPTASTINFTPASGAIANQISIKIGPDGKINIYNKFGDARVIVDVSGYYATAAGASGSRFVATYPARIFDASVDENTTTPVQIAGKGELPASGIAAVVVNITVAQPTKDGYLTAFPTGEALPDASSINFTAGSGGIANQITLKVGADGRVNVFNPFGTARVIMDVSGYFGATGSRFISVNPDRLDDSSYTENKIKPFKLLGQKGVPPSHVTAVVINVTAATPSKAGYVAVYPFGMPVPDTSTVNFSPSTGAIANQIIAKLGPDGKINVQNRWGNTRVILDISGYFINNDELEVVAYDASKVMPANPNMALYTAGYNIAYGPSASHRFNIHESANRQSVSAANRATLVWFYGGGWENGDNNLTTAYDNIAKHLAAEYGYKLIAANYRKSGEAPYPAQYQDAIALVKFLKANAATYDIDPNRIILGGFSAGGDIATMAGLGYNAPEFQPNFVPANVAQQSALVYRLLTFATPFDKSAWSRSYASNASPIAGLNKLLGNASTSPDYTGYLKLDALQYATNDDPPHYTVMSDSDQVIPFNTQYPALVAIGKRSSTLLQIGGPNKHVSGLDASVSGILEYLK
ncbi:MAG: alpha/beta hydrolase [Candidatus Saccharibacteria bacterium]|nr:alpha/beta hydrolase [Candidatus Saccharibacteria bacterium]